MKKSFSAPDPNRLKPVFHLAILFARTEKKVGTVPTCSRRIFSPAKFNQSRWRILVFASRRASKVEKWKTGLKETWKFEVSSKYALSRNVELLFFAQVAYS